jgi:hypothetical protein
MPYQTSSQPECCIQSSTAALAASSGVWPYRSPMMLIDEWSAGRLRPRRDGLRRPDDHLSSNSEQGEHNAHNNVKRC